MCGPPSLPGVRVRGCVRPYDHHRFVRVYRNTITKRRTKGSTKQKVPTSGVNQDERLAMARRTVSAA